MPKIDEHGVERFNEDDLAQFRGCADEPNFDRFVERLGGCRLDTLHPDPKVQNADYIFERDKTLIELKTLETEVGNTLQFREKMTVLNRRMHAKHGKTPLAACFANSRTVVSVNPGQAFQ